VNARIHFDARARSRVNVFDTPRRYVCVGLEQTVDSTLQRMLVVECKVMAIAERPTQFHCRNRVPFLRQCNEIIVAGRQVFNTIVNFKSLCLTHVNLNDVTIRKHHFIFDNSRIGIRHARSRFRFTTLINNMRLQLFGKRDFVTKLS